jgi:glycosyltransferase involved in cell wall biosynthesis
MKVLHLITNLEPDGAQIALLDLLRHLPGPGDDFAVAYLMGHPRALRGRQPANFRLLDLSRAGRPDPLLIGRLIRLLRGRRYDLVHTHLVHAGIAGKIAASVAGSIPVVTTRHYASDAKEGTFLYRVENRLTRRCAAVIAVSEAVRAHLIERGIARAERIVTILNGVDSRLFDPSLRRSDRASHAGAPRIGTVGRLHPQKGQAVGLRAFASILQRYPGATFEIIGTGGLRDSLAAQARDLGIAGGVRFLGSVPREELAERMAGWDLAIFPSLWEGFGIAAAEASAMELPVIASRIEGLAEIVEDGATGLLVPPGDPAALAEAVVRVLSNSGAAREMGRAGRIRVASRYSIPSAADQTRQVYESVLARDGSAGWTVGIARRSGEGKRTR